MDIYDRIESLMSEHDVRPYRLAKDINGLSTGLLSQWKKRTQYPSRDKLKLVADYFGVSVEYLLTGENKKEPTTVSGDEPSSLDRDLAKYLRLLSDDQKRFLLAQMMTLLKSQE